MRSARLAPLAVAIVADVATKAWALSILAEPVRITDWLYLALHLNEGIYLGAAPIAAIELLYLAVIALVVVWLVKCVLAAGGWWVRTGWSLYAAGAVGNGLWRLLGPVPDFIAIGPVVPPDQWLFFNLADVFLVAGFLLLGSVLLRRVLRWRGADSHP